MKEMIKMDFYLYDSRSKAKKKLQPQVKNHVYIYVCGPTVYNHAHIGNARPLIVFDTLRRALSHLEKGRINIFVAGTGNPYFTTDTASVLRATEMRCDVILKGTQVDGVYDKDPKKYPDAVRFDKISFDEAIKRDLRVMDPTALTLARDNNMPILVFKISEQDAFLNAIKGEGKYTIISND